MGANVVVALGVEVISREVLERGAVLVASVPSSRFLRAGENFPGDGESAAMERATRAVAKKRAIRAAGMERASKAAARGRATGAPAMESSKLAASPAAEGRAAARVQQRHPESSKLAATQSLGCCVEGAAREDGGWGAVRVHGRRGDRRPDLCLVQRRGAPSISTAKIGRASCRERVCLYV